MYLKTIGLLCMILIMSASEAQTPSADSLSRIAFVKKQTAKGDSLMRVAMTRAKPGTDNQQLNQSLNDLDKALHIYSRFREMTGVRQCFDNLAFVYRLQKKHSQEKWYILQSNTTSRNQNDTPNIINSLVRLATVKCDIKDYALAAQDLNEVAYLAQKTRNIEARIVALKSLSDVYQKTHDLKNSARMLNKIDQIRDSVQRSLLTKNLIPGTDNAQKDGLSPVDTLKMGTGKSVEIRTGTKPYLKIYAIDYQYIYIDYWHSLFK